MYMCTCVHHRSSLTNIMLCVHVLSAAADTQATSAEELPERMLCQCRLWGLDFASAAPHMPSSHTHRSHTA